MKIKVLLLSLLFFAELFAQYPRIVLLEEATNTACPDCAVLTPKVQNYLSTHFGTAVMVEYHAWWPSSGDPFYTANTQGNANRINYYGYYFVPIYGLDGKTFGEPANIEELAFNVAQRAEVPAPVWIHVKHSVQNGNFVVQGFIKAAEAVNSSNLKLRVAVIEREKELSSSGSENLFTNVFRKFLPSPAGTNVEISEGDSIAFNFSTGIPEEWDASELAAVVWIQNDDTKEVVQSNISVPVFRIESKDSYAQLLQSNTETLRHFTIRNSNADTLKLKISSSVSSIPEGWQYGIIYNGVETDSFKVNIPPTDSVSFGLKIKTANNDGEIKGRVIAENLTDPHRWSNSSGFYGVMITNKILLVDDDGGAQGEIYWENALKDYKDFGVDYFVLDHKYLHQLMADKNEFDFPAVFWNSANSSPGLDSLDVLFLKNYLDGGGKLFICGQNIGEDIFNHTGESNNEAVKDFYHNYLDADFISGNTGYYLIGGLDGTQFAGINFALNTFYERNADAIKSFSGSNDEVFVFKDDSSLFAGINHVTTNYHTIYLTFSIEQMIPRSKQKEIMENVLTSFGYIIEKAGNVFVPENYLLYEIYPNPFSANEKINFTVPKNFSGWFKGKGGNGAKVKLEVFDVLGRRIATLVNKRLFPGAYSFSFNGRKLPSGVYFYKLNVNGVVITKKAVKIY